MTREEAITIIENEKKCVNRANKNDYCNRDCYNCELVKTDTEILTALEMAIKALEQEPCDDCISREATVKRLCQIAEIMNKERDGLGSPYVMAALFIQDNNDEFPSVTPQPCDDAISRQAVDVLVDELARAISDERCCMSRGRSTATIMQDILYLPSVTPQPKMGRWIFHKPFDIGHKNCNECIECSQCHTWLGYDCYAKTPYCPNCGCKMQEVKDENDRRLHRADIRNFGRNRNR